MGSRFEIKYLHGTILIVGNFSDACVPKLTNKRIIQTASFD